MQFTQIHIMHHSDGHFPGKLWLAGCPFYFHSALVSSLSTFQGQAITLHIFLPTRSLGIPNALYPQSSSPNNRPNSHHLHYTYINIRETMI